MSEREPILEGGKEKYVDPAEVEKQQEKLAEHHEKEADNAEDRQDSIEVIKERLEKAQKQESASTRREEKPAAETVTFTSKAAKEHYFAQTVKRTQKKLPTHEKTFSKFLHQPVVEKVSDVGGATVARPSGLLFGGIFSVIASLIILYICRRYGYEYNFLVGMASFAGGFAIGLLVEGTAKLVRRQA